MPPRMINFNQAAWFKSKVGSYGGEQACFIGVSGLLTAGHRTQQRCLPTTMTDKQAAVDQRKRVMMQTEIKKAPASEITPAHILHTIM